MEKNTGKGKEECTLLKLSRLIQSILFIKK